MKERSITILSLIGIKNFVAQPSHPTKLINYMFVEPILALHEEEFVELKEAEKSLLHKILQSSGNMAALQSGTFEFREDEAMFKKNSIKDQYKVVVDFTQKIRGSNVISAPPLCKLLAEPDLKKNLWQEMLIHLKN